MNKITQLTVAVLTLNLVQLCFADGFSLVWAREHEAHIVIQLTPEQVAIVGRERKLVLTQAQHDTLANFKKPVPKIIGVESLGETDCSCCISSALWTANSEMTIWLDRLARDDDGSKDFFELRLEHGFYTMDVTGQIFQAGQPKSWAAFQAAVLTSKEGEYIQLSRPPLLPEAVTARIAALKERKNFQYRL